MTSLEIEFATFRVSFYVLLCVCEEYLITLVTILEMGDLSLYSDELQSVRQVFSFQQG
jgi:hypothetical protein